MANEIQVQIKLGCTNGNFVLPELGSPHSINQNHAGQRPGGGPGYVIVGTTKVSVDLSGFTKPGYLYMRNLGYLGTGTNGDPVITWGPESGGNLVPCGDLKVAEEGCFRLTSIYSPTLAFISTEDDSVVQLVILED